MAMGLGLSAITVSAANIHAVGASAPALPSPVQSTGTKAVAASANATDTVTAASNFTAGNTVIIAVVAFNDTSVGASFSGITVSGTAAVEDANIQHVDNANYRASIWRATNVTGGNPNVVFSWTNGAGGTHILTCGIEEWSSLTATPVDSVPAAVRTTATSESITSAVLAQAKEVVYAVGSVTNANVAGFTGPTGFTVTASDVTPTNLAALAGYKAVNATTAVTAAFSQTGSVESDLVMVTYKSN